MPPQSDARTTLLAVSAVGIVSAALLLLARRRRQRAAAPASILATYDARPLSDSKPWYQHVVVTHRARGARGAVRALHLGCASNPPESIVHLALDAAERASWLPVAGVLEKPHIRFTLLAFGWIDGGFEPEARACLVGVAGGSLLHFWRECVPGGTTLRVDAVEYDGAVLDAARDHLGLRACEPPRGRCALHVADGARFLEHADDEAYDLLVIDLDMGALIASAQHSAAPAPAPEAAPSSSAARRRRQRLGGGDPTRDMYRVLSSRGVLVINEYSEDSPSRRLEASVRLVRLLRRYFPQVHHDRL